MLNLKLADAFVDLSLQRGRFDADVAKVLKDIRGIPANVDVNIRVRDQSLTGAVQRIRALRTAAAAPIVMQFRVDRAGADAAINLLNQHIRSVRQAQTIQLRADLRAWNRAMIAVFTDLSRVRLAANIPIATNTARAHSNLNLLIQQLQTARGLTNMPVNVPRVPGFGMGGGRGGAGGFGTGIMMGLGMPYAANPQMMAGQMISGALVGTVRTAAHLETEFAQLERITGLTAEQMGKFKATLLEMGQTRPGVSIQDLTEMSQIGGRMGVVDKAGPEGLKAFVDQLARVKLAVTDIGTEELANQVGRVLNVFNLGTEYVAGFGSALVAMDNVSTASAKDILNITQRLSGTAQAIGLTLPQVTALASVLKDVGLENEVAGSSFSQIFRLMATKSDEFAEKIGVDAKKFADAYRTDPMEALRMVIDKFKEMKDTLAGQEFIAELGFKGVRTAGSLQQLASKFDEVRRRSAAAAAETGTQASLGAAGSIMGRTTESGFQQARNGITDLADALGSTLAPAAKYAAREIGGAATGLASVIRGTNRAGFGGAPNAPPQAAPAALPATNPTPFLPKTVDEAKADVEAARQKAAAAEADAVAKNKEADRLGFEGREAMRGAAGQGPQAMAGAEQQMQRAFAAQEAAAKAAESANRAAEDLKAALERQRDAQKDEDKKQAGFKAEDAVNALKQKALGVFGAISDAKQSVLGIGAKALIKTANAVMPDEEKPQHYTVGTDMLDAGRRIQEQILNSKADKDRNAEATAKNTGEAVSLLAQAVEALKRGANQTVGAALGKP